MPRYHLPSPALLGVVALVALGGCAPMARNGPPPGLAPTPCPQEQCDLVVTVTGDCKKEGAISVRPPLAEVRDRDNLMRWRIDTPGYEFEPGKGIDFSLFSPFKELKSHDPKVARVLNRNDGLPGDYKYDVNIKGCKSLDPWVRNTE